MQKRLQIVSRSGPEHISTLFRIPEWMFVERPDLASVQSSDVRYLCPVCGIIEPRACVNGYWRRECGCTRQRRETTALVASLAQTNAAQAVRHTSKTYTWLAEEDIDLETKTFETFQSQYQQAAFKKARAYAATFAVGVSPNLLLSGGYGTGKTHLAVAILNELRTKATPCLFCTAQSLFNALYAASGHEKQAVLQQASSTPLLVLDDLDKLYIKQAEDEEKAGRYQKDTLFDILDKRYRRRYPTVITTNAAQSLHTWLNPATLDRLYEACELVEMNGESYRRMLAAQRMKGGK